MNPSRPGLADQRTAQLVPLMLVLIWILSHKMPGATGALDLNFDPGGGADDMVRAIAVEPSGSMVIGGSFRSFDTNACSGLVRLHSDGRVDEGFDAALNGSFLRVQCIVPQPDGDMIIGGRFEGVQGTRRHGIARLDASGLLDPAFVTASVNSRRYQKADSCWWAISVTSTI